MTTISGFIAVQPDHYPNINDVASARLAAWDNVCDAKDRPRWERNGCRVVPCKLVIEDGKP
jgi:hypothetical protein